MMNNRLYLDGRCFQTPKELHGMIASILDFPDYYGKNADALYDVLSDQLTLPEITVAAMGQGDVAEELRRCIRVFRDLGCDLTLRGSLSCEE